MNLLVTNIYQPKEYELNNATRSEIIFAEVMQRAPDLITDESTASLGRFLGNIVHHVGPPFCVFMMSAGKDGPECVTMGIAKNLPGKIKKLVKSSPIPIRTGVYTMVPSFKQALQIRSEIKDYLEELFPHTDNGWYWVPNGLDRIALQAVHDVASDHDFATNIYFYHPKVNNAALDGLKAGLEKLRDEAEDRIGSVM